MQNTISKAELIKRMNDREQQYPANVRQVHTDTVATALPLHLEQANGQTTIYDAKLNVLFRVDGRHFDALSPIVASANQALAAYEEAK